jgi:hypothetical protein
MRYYIYVSDAKVDMLSAQIPESLFDVIAADLELDLKVLKVRLRETAVPDNRFTRLAAVENYIRRQFSVGTVDEPGPYFAGTMDLRWAQLGETDEDSVVYFGGMTDRTILGLGGSLRHLVGRQCAGGTVWGSALPFMQAVLAKELGLPVELECREPGMTDDDVEQLALQGVSRATCELKGPAQRLEFLAKRLLPARGTEQDQKVQALLGTPIYVALAD